MPKRTLTELEHRNTKVLEKTALSFCLMFTTATGLGKGFFDATIEIQDFLSEHKIHDFKSQQAGDEHKLYLPAYLGHPDRTQTRMSLYRPATKNGVFKRIWFSNLKNHIGPDQVLAIIALPKKFAEVAVVWGINISTSDLQLDESKINQTSKPNSTVKEMRPLTKDGNLPNISRQLERLLPGGPDTRGAPPPWAKVETGLENHLAPNLKTSKPTLVVLSGNAGDGKTAFLEHMLVGAGEQPTRGQNQYDDIEIGDGSYMIVMDGSEDSKDLGSDELLDVALSPFAGREIRSNVDRGLLIAINKGKLLDFLNRRKEKYEKLHQLAEDIFVEARETKTSPYRFIDLNHRSLLSPDHQNSFFGKFSDKLQDWSEWNQCQQCPAIDDCPIRSNLSVISDTEQRKNIWSVFDAIDLDDKIHLTARHVVSSLVASVLADNTCSDIQDRQQTSGYESLHRSAHIYNYLFDNIKLPDSKFPKSVGDVASYFDPSQRTSTKHDRRVGATISEYEKIESILGLSRSEENLGKLIKDVGEFEGTKPSDQPKLARNYVEISTQMARRDFVLGPSQTGGPTQPHRQNLPLVSLEKFRDAVSNNKSNSSTLEVVVTGLNGLLGIRSSTEDLVVSMGPQSGFRGSSLAKLIPKDSLKLEPGAWVSHDELANEVMTIRPRTLTITVVTKDGNRPFLEIPLSLFEVLIRAAMGHLPIGQVGSDVMERVRGGYSTLNSMPGLSSTPGLVRHGEIVGQISDAGVFTKSAIGNGSDE